jgi:hypothetical protein
MERTVETKSSKMLTGTFPAPPVVAVTAGRTAMDFTAWTLPETNRPSAIEKERVHIGDDTGAGGKENGSRRPAGQRFEQWHR